MDYTTLVADKNTAGSIRNWVNRDDIPVTDILTEAQAWIYLELRHVDMLTFIDFQIDQGQSEKALPADFLQPIEWRPVEWGWPLPYVHERALRQDRQKTDPATPGGQVEQGFPQRWAVLTRPTGAANAMVKTMVLNTRTDEDMPGQLMYYGRPAPLLETNETNFLTDEYPTLVRHACMYKAYEHRKDTERTAQYLALATNDRDIAKENADLYRFTQYYPAPVPIGGYYG